MNNEPLLPNATVSAAPASSTVASYPPTTTAARAPGRKRAAATHAPRRRFRPTEPVFALRALEGRVYWCVWPTWRACDQGEPPAGWGSAKTESRAVLAARRLVPAASRVNDDHALPWSPSATSALWHVVPDGRGGLRSCRHRVESPYSSALWYVASCQGADVLERLAPDAFEGRSTAAGECLVELLPGLIVRTPTLLYATDPLTLNGG